jgi:hypothetical protein
METKKGNKMKVIEKTISENGKQINYKFQNGFYAYVNQHGFTLRGAKGGLITPFTKNWNIAAEAIKQFNN